MRRSRTRSRACGYAPRDDGAGGIALENCPFHALAARHTDLVCGANLELVRGDREPPQAMIATSLSSHGRVTAASPCTRRPDD